MVRLVSVLALCLCPLPALGQEVDALIAGSGRRSNEKCGGARGRKGQAPPCTEKAQGPTIRTTSVISISSSVSPSVAVRRMITSWVSPAVGVSRVLIAALLEKNTRM